MGILDSIINLRREPKCALAPIHPLFGQVSTILGHDVTRTHDFEARLVPAINEAVAYFDRQINIIPQAIPVSLSDHGRDTAVTGIFPSRDDIAQAVGRSIDVRQSLPRLAGAGSPYFYGLLGMRRRPDDPSEALTDHTIRGLATTEAGARSDLRDAALTRLVTNFGEHVDKLHRKGKLLRVEWQMEHGEADNRLPIGEDFVYAGKELLPENMMRGLISWLKDPAEHLQITPPEVAADQGSFSIGKLPVLHSADRRHWIACFVRMATQECVQLMNQERRIHRYIFI